MILYYIILLSFSSFICNFTIRYAIINKNNSLGIILNLKQIYIINNESTLKKRIACIYFS